MATQPEPWVYDKASWHAEGDFPNDLDETAAAVHIGVALAWFVLNGFGSESLLGTASNEVNSLRKKRVTPADFLCRVSGGVFSSDLLNEVAQQFAYDYYEGRYLEDYSKVVSLLIGEGETLYHAPDSWTTYCAVSPVLRQRLEEWNRGGDRGP